MTTALEQARELGDRRGLASDLSQAVRDLDRLEKRVTIDAAFAVRLAAMIVNLEAIRKALPRDDGSPQSTYFRTEHASLAAGVNTALRQYVLQTGDHRPSTLGLQAWARKILLTNKAEREAAEARRAARAAGLPQGGRPITKPITTKARASRKPGFCWKHDSYAQHPDWCKDCRLAQRRLQAGS